MEMEGLKCNGCGSSNVVFDPQRRILVCHQCGKEEYYSRATLNSNGKVVFSKQNAMNFFMEGKIDKAQHYALDILNISKDNAPALYMIAYNDEFVLHRDGAIKRFFVQIEEVPLEYDEVRDLIKLFRASVNNLADYEFMLLTLLAKNMQSNEDIPELSELIEQICPLYISHRPSSNYLTKENAEIYKELAEHCDIPKTCFALLKSIQTNPDSPYSNNSFYLKSRSQYFYDHYVVLIGDVIESMKNSEFKTKFLISYQKINEQYIQKLNGH